jgi:hypothetical protein
MTVMRSLFLAGAVLALAASPAAAQRLPDITAPKRAANRAADAQDQQLAAETGQQVKLRSGPATAPTAAPAPAAHAPAPDAKGTTIVGVAPKSAQSLAKVPPVTREVFSYDAAGRRDPFFSLILTDDLRPLLSDLKLVGVLYSPGNGRSVAIFRDIQTNAQYRVQTGAPLGRMRVAQIKPRGVIFTIDEFGLSRQDSLMLMTDTTKVRIR